MALFGLLCPGCILVLLLIFFYVREGFNHFHERITKLEGFTPNIVSTVPLSREYLWQEYLQKLKTKGAGFNELCVFPKSGIPEKEKSLYNYKPYQVEEKIELQAAQYDLNAHNQWKQRCRNLSFADCLTEPSCGWLQGPDGTGGECQPGTPIGPLNPLKQPEAEEGRLKNTQLDQWIYSYSYPWNFHNR